MNNLESLDLSSTRVPDLERIRNAKRKRAQQLKRWAQYDKNMEKKEKKGRTSTSPPPGSNPISRQHPGLSRNVQFSQAVILLEAAARDDLDEVRKLLSQGVCPNVTNTDGLTALHQCCIDNNQEMCRLLLRFGADVNARDTELWTPLHAAATCCHSELCKILIDNGADLLAVNADGNMPYDICEDDSTLDLIENEMASRGITQEDIDEKRRVPEREMLAAMEHLVRTGSDLNQLDSQGAAPLHIAAACGYLDVVGFLLQHGANIDLPDRDGWMAIHVAACWGQYEVIEMLTNFGAKLDTPTMNGGETVFDICEDEKLHERLVILREELKRWQNFHLAQNQTSTTNGNGDINNKTRGLSRRRSSNPRSSSIRRTSMRDKAKISWKEAQQEAETRSLIVQTADGDSVVEEVVKTPVWMTAVDDSHGGVDTSMNSVGRKSSPPETTVIPSSMDLQHRRPTGPSILSPLPINSNSRSRTSNNGSAVKNNSRDPATTASDGPRSLPVHKSDPLGKKQPSSNDSPTQRNRHTNRLGDPTSSNRTSTGSQPTLQNPPAPLYHHQTSVNGVSSSNILLHNAYYPVNSQTTSASVSTGQNPTGTKNWSQGRTPPPSHILISTGAKPMAHRSPGVVASPLQPGASLTRPPLKRELLINNEQRNGINNSSGKCCILM